MELRRHRRMEGGREGRGRGWWDVFAHGCCDVATNGLFSSGIINPPLRLGYCMFALRLAQVPRYPSTLTCAWVSRWSFNGNRIFDPWLPINAVLNCFVSCSGPEVSNLSTWTCAWVGRWSFNGNRIFDPQKIPVYDCA